MVNALFFGDAPYSVYGNETLSSYVRSLLGEDVPGNQAIPTREQEVTEAAPLLPVTEENQEPPTPQIPYATQETSLVPSTEAEEDSQNPIIAHAVSEGARSLDFERFNEGMDDIAINDMTRYMQTLAQKTNSVSEEFLSRRATGLARDIHINWATRTVYVVADHIASVLQAQGTFKKARSAFGFVLPSLEASDGNTQSASIQHCVHLTSNKPGHVPEIQNEVPFLNALSDVPGVIRLHGALSYVERDSLCTAPSPSISLILNYAERGNLSSIIESMPAPIRGHDHRISIARQLLATFAIIQDRGIFHGDLKPDNIFLGTNDAVYISDFGMARFLRPGMVPHMTINSSQYGTPFYSAPELRNRPRTLPSFGQDRATADNNFESYKKLESWTMGLILALMAFGSGGFHPPLNLTMDAFEASINTMAQCIPANEAERTTEEHFEWIIRNLMDSNPATRWTIAAANAYMNQYLSVSSINQRERNLLPDDLLTLLPVPPTPVFAPVTPVALMSALH